MKEICVFWVVTGTMWATTLSGTLNLPNGTGASGTLYMALSQQAAFSPSTYNTAQPPVQCSTVPPGGGSPTQMVPVQFSFTVTNGSLAGTPTIAGNDCLLPQGTWYNVRFNDPNGNLVFTDRWLIVGTTQDVGTIISVVISGTTQTLGQSGVILTNPGSAVCPAPAAIPAQQICQGNMTTPLTVDYLTVSGKLVFPDNSGCTGSSCTFVQPTFFPSGIQTAQFSYITIGPTGQFYNRLQTGADLICSVGGLNGFQVIREDTSPPQLEFCVNDVTYYLPLIPLP